MHNVASKAEVPSRPYHPHLSERGRRSDGYVTGRLLAPMAAALKQTLNITSGKLSSDEMIAFDNIREHRVSQRYAAFSARNIFSHLNRTLHVYILQPLIVIDQKRAATHS